MTWHVSMPSKYHISSLISVSSLFILWLLLRSLCIFHRFYLNELPKVHLNSWWRTWRSWRFGLTTIHMSSRSPILKQHYFNTWGHLAWQGQSFLVERVLVVPALFWYQGKLSKRFRIVLFEYEPNLRYQDANIEELTLTSCSIPLISLHGCHVTTVEGVGDTRQGLHPVQVQNWKDSSKNLCTSWT